MDIQMPTTYHAEKVSNQPIEINQGIAMQAASASSLDAHPSSIVDGIIAEEIIYKKMVGKHVRPELLGCSRSTSQKLPR